MTLLYTKLHNITLLPTKQHNTTQPYTILTYLINPSREQKRKPDGHCKTKNSSSSQSKGDMPGQGLLHSFVQITILYYVFQTFQTLPPQKQIIGPIDKKMSYIRIASYKRDESFLLHTYQMSNQGQLTNKAVEIRFYLFLILSFIKGELLFSSVELVKVIVLNLKCGP